MKIIIDKLILLIALLLDLLAVNGLLIFVIIYTLLVKENIHYLLKQLSIFILIFFNKCYNSFFIIGIYITSHYIISCQVMKYFFFCFTLMLKIKLKCCSLDMSRSLRGLHSTLSSASGFTTGLTEVLSVSQHLKGNGLHCPLDRYFD